jgi:Arc/MetJ family transcription regulator
MLGASMRTTITIQDEILQELMKHTNAKTRTEAVNKALIDWVKRLKTEKLRSLRGKFQIEDNWEKLRAHEIRETRSAYHAKRSR